MSSKVTMKMIAEEVGTSVGTVDRALNNRGRISADMKARILLAAEELGYKPNMFAQKLRKETIFKLLVVVRKDPQYVYYALQQGIDNALYDYIEFGIDAEIIYTDTMSREDTINLLKRLDINDFSAMLIDVWYPELSALVKRFKSNGKPVVSVHIDFPKASCDTFIGSDTLQGAQLAANYIGELLRNHGSLFIVDEEKAGAQWLEQLKTMLSCHYPRVSVSTLQWSQLQHLSDSDVLLLCGPIDSQQRSFLSHIHSAIICTQIDRVIHQMLMDGHVSAVICDNLYQQGYQGVQCVINALMHNVSAQEPSLLISPQLILRASLPSLYLPPLSSDTTA